LGTSLGRYAHWQAYDSSAAFPLKRLTELAASVGGTSHRRHWSGRCGWPWPFTCHHSWYPRLSTSGARAGH